MHALMLKIISAAELFSLPEIVFGTHKTKEQRFIMMGRNMHPLRKLYEMGITIRALRS